MAPPFPRADIELDYPIYAVDFDPEDATRLAVGGGGGAGRSGVGNKMTLLDVSRQDEIRIAGEIELSRDEDSVSSLAVGPRRGRATHLFAGVNSSPADVEKGINRHLRVFSAEPARAKPLPPPAASTDAAPRASFPAYDITEVSRTALFTNPDASAYQRLLRVSGALGAAASALGKDAQVAVFEATSPNPTVRGVLELASEAEGLDLLQTGAREHQLAYCDKHALYTVAVGAASSSDPELVFSMPDDHGERPQFRAIRYLTPEFVLAVANLPRKNTGALIQGLRLPSPGHQRARLAVTARIPGKLSATALAVTNLSRPAAAAGPVGDTQFVVAVAGNDSSIRLYTLQHQATPNMGLLFNLHPFCTLKSVHGQGQISGLAFSTFKTPKAHVRAQHVKLASTSLQRTVAVHSIPLRKHVDKAPPSGTSTQAPPPPARYAVAMPSRGPSARPVVTSLALIVLVLAIVSQSVMEMCGAARPVVFGNRFLPSWHGSLARRAAGSFEHGLASSLAGGKVLRAGEKLVLLEPAPADGGREAVLVDVHDAEAHGAARTWDQLRAEEKRAWKERLRDAGAWTQGMGESVFRGVLFGELAGMVGRAVAG
ncbi:uncharacterized protein UV8b_03575 [Ustilaginoidea virens]|uniref:Guanine nucleotide-exchange factor SEC12 n=1 Tax=Ustilaginoidea virens TaxID=1159556 RepID=A0A063BZZ9_USTVR|nr:uncharacterized protein UV8b_03575 [Ustilaginoidea virens]QUC19334.1 hypothetical protein UV8b_03575 [Ustilaginoidea virens]GAO13171.1 hypothetical protein UVI_02025260 [Ustilaginoidea virens]